MEKKINIMAGELYIYFSLKNPKKEKEVLEFILEKINYLVDTFNFFDSNSKLSKLNKLRKIENNSDLNFLLNESLHFYKISNGLFNVFSGKLIKDRKKNLESYKKNTNNLKIKLKEDKIILDDKETLIDLGGIAKGYILDKTLELTLEKYGKEVLDVLFDARGDIVTYGNSKKLIEVENPFEQDMSFEEINLKKGSIITSGHNKQYFKYGSHILGEESDIITITLISDTLKCYQLDALGTYLIQLDSEEILEKIEFDEYYKEIECLLILKNGQVIKSSFWDKFK